MKLLDAAALEGAPLPTIGDKDGKDERGRVLIIGGGEEVPGGVMLAAEASLRVGAGKLQIATAQAVAPSMALAIPEARVVGLLGREPGADAWRLIKPLAEHADAIVLGPGMFDEEAAASLASDLAQTPAGASVLLDAAALTGLRGKEEALRPLAGRLVMTPHAGEMAKLMDCSREEVEADPAEFAINAAWGWGAVVAMKGATTFIATPQGDVWRHPEAVRGLGTSGSGDVLAGVIGGLLARGADPETAVMWGVFLHAAAGAQLAQTIGPLGFLARELLPTLPGLLAEHGGAKD